MAQHTSTILPATLDNISQPGLSGSGAHTTTTPSQEHCLTLPKSNGGCNASVQTDEYIGRPNWLPTFSPQLCLALLPTLDTKQVNLEIEYNRSIGIDVGVKKNTPHVKRADFLRNKLLGDSASILHKNMEDLSKYESLTSTFSGMLEKAEKFVEEMKTETRRTADSSTHTNKPCSAPAPEQFVNSSPPPKLTI